MRKKEEQEKSKKSIKELRTNERMKEQTKGNNFKRNKII